LCIILVHVFEGGGRGGLAEIDKLVTAVLVAYDHETTPAKTYSMEIRDGLIWASFVFCGGLCVMGESTFPHVSRGSQPWNASSIDQR
jgi:hypothetical protein